MSRYAKTLYKPEFPRQIKKDIQVFTKQLLPHFFVYAKDKSSEQVKEPNGTFVNRLYDYIPNPRLRCTYMNGDGKRKALGKPDYHFLMTNPNLELTKNNNGKIVNPVVIKYSEMASQYGYKISAISEDSATWNLPRKALYKPQIKQQLLFGKLYEKIKIELSQFGNTEEEIADILVKYLYDIKDSKNKDILWACYGDILYNNLKDRVKPSTKEIQCIDCGEWFEVGKFNSATCRCENCQKEHKRELKRLEIQRYRQRKKNVGATP